MIANLNRYCAYCIVGILPLLTACGAAPTEPTPTYTATQSLAGQTIEWDVSPGDLATVQGLMMGWAVAWEARDKAAFEAILTDDFIWHMNITDGNPAGRAAIGSAGILTELEARQTSWHDVQYTDHRFFGTASRLFQTYHATGRTDRFGAFDVNGVDVYVLRDGKIASKDSYWKITTEPN